MKNSEYFNEILKIVKSHYLILEGKEKNYLFDKNSRIVGTITQNLIVLYYSCDSNVIWNHKGVVAVAFAKDFILAKGNNVKRADVIFIEGLCGACEDIKVVDDFYIKTTGSSEIRYMLEKYGRNCVGNVTCNGNSFKLNSDYFNINFEGNYFNDYASNFNLLVLNVNKRDKIDYEVLYNYMRKEYDWYFTTGYNNCSSARMREFVETRKNRNYEEVSMPKVKILNTKYNSKIR